MTLVPAIVCLGELKHKVSHLSGIVLLGCLMQNLIVLIAQTDQSDGGRIGLGPFGRL